MPASRPATSGRADARQDDVRDGPTGSRSAREASPSAGPPRALRDRLTALSDLRHDSVRATKRRREAEDALLDAMLLPSEGTPYGVDAEGQTLLMKSLARLERQDDVEAAVAWSIDAEGKPAVMAALPAEAASRVEPTPELYSALIGLDRVQRLTDSDLEHELEALCAHGVSAAAPVPGLGSTPVAVLLLHPIRSGRPLRPRTIAVLGEVAARLRESLSTSLALTRLSRLDGAVQQLDRMATLGGLVSEIVHEIRNPLVSVKTFLQLLPDRLADPEFHGDFRNVVSDEVGRLERMLEDLLRHSRPTPRHTEIEAEARLAEVVETTFQLLGYRCRERGITLETDLRDDLPALALPEDGLRQLLMNLLINASEVTPSGGRVRVHADWSAEAVNHIEVRVDDDGPGIQASLRPQVFEPFWTTRRESAGGLGLAICKRIIDEAGGSIELIEGERGGACFRIQLPIAR